MFVRSYAYPELDRDLTFHPLGDHGLQHLIPFQVSDVNTRGFICPLNAFTSRELQHHRNFFKVMQQTIACFGSSYSINGLHQRCWSVQGLVTEQRILNYVQDLLEPNFMCWGTH